LQKWSAGDSSAEARLFELVMPELRRIATYFMRTERPDHSLEPTGLVNEIYFKLSGIRNLEWRDRHHFFAIVARAMRRHLIDHARRRQAVVRLPNDEAAESISPGQDRMVLAIEVDRLLEEMAVEHPELSAVVELKFFLGLTDEEAAEASELPLRTFQRRWRDARKWLFERLGPQKCDQPPSKKTTAS